MIKKTFIASIFLAFFSVSAMAQIPNAGFEIWSGNEPASWDNLNSLTSTLFIYTCTKGTPGNPGTSFIKLTTKTVPLVGVVPGIALSGKIDKTTFQPKSGFAYNQRPTALTGNWQYMAASANDQGFIGIAFTKWNTSSNKRDTLSATYYLLPGMVMSWENFSIPITFTSPSNPDTCLIVLSSSSITTPVANSYLYIDNLDFSFTTSVDKNKILTLKVYPNPVTENIKIEIPDITNSFAYSYKIINSLGQIIQSADHYKTAEINTSNLPKGFYQLMIENKGIQYLTKFIKQ